ncbi:hypothetical protein HYS93_04210 [Candidatus Daviesbacteria bacterium]|nr:hypothetical protein [Candidatus Daviesbacteria bacterium]
MEALKEGYISRYEGQGPFVRGSWKSDSDRLFGPLQTVAVWQNLIDASLVPVLDTRLVFVSPTAAEPTHELAIWQFERARQRPKSHFLVGDIRQIDPNSTYPNLCFSTVLDEAGSCRRGAIGFQYFRWDAERLPIAPGAVNVLWDRKGWLWHLANDIKDPQRLWENFRRYHRILVKDGILVIDAIEGFDRSLTDGQRRKLHQMYEEFQKGEVEKYLPSDIFPDPPGQYEHSTVDLISKCDPDIWNKLPWLFAIKDVGEGVEKVRVLVKK